MPTLTDLRLAYRRKPETVPEAVEDPCEAELVEDPGEAEPVEDPGEAEPVKKTKKTKKSKGR